MADIIIGDEQPRRVYAVGSTPQSAFTVPFPFLADSDVRVVVNAGLADDVLALGADYTVTGAGGQSGTVTLTGPVKNCTVTVYRELVIERSTAFPAAGTLKIPALNREFDRAIMIDQQQQAQLDRTLKLAQSDDPGANATLPVAQQRAGRFFVFDREGRPKMSDATVSQVEGVALAAWSQGHSLGDVPQYIGDGVRTRFPTGHLLTSKAGVHVEVGGVFQAPGAYSLDGEDVVLSEPAPAGAEVHIRVLGVPVQLADASGSQVTAMGAPAPRSLAERFSEVTNVRDFGAKGDGEADDTDALQEAIARTGAVFLPAGRYRISAPIYVPSNTAIYGEAPEATQVTAVQPGMDAFQFGDGGSVVARSSLADIAINVLGGITKTDGAAVHLNYTARCDVRNVRIANHFRGLRITKSIETHAAGVHVIGLPAGVGIGVLIDGTIGHGNDHYLRDVLVVGDPMACPLAAFWIEQTLATWMDTCGGLWCHHGLVLAPGPGQTVEHLFSSRCAWDTTNSHAMLIAPAAGGKVQRSTFIGDWTCSSVSGDGMRIDGPGLIQGLEFIGHRAMNNGGHGARLAAGTGVRFLGGLYSGNSAAAPNTCDGIHVASGVGYFDIDVHARREAEYPNSQRYGVCIEDGPSDHYSVDGNLSPNVTGALYDGGSGADKNIHALGVPGGLRRSAAGLIGSAGQTVKVGLRAAASHAISNAGSIALTVTDGGGDSGVFVENIHDGTYSSQRVVVRTSWGGVVAATDRLTIEKDGAITNGSSTLFDAGGALVLRSFTVATLPSAATAAKQIYVSDRGRPAWSDGSAWKFADGTTVS